MPEQRTAPRRWKDDDLLRRAAFQELYRGLVGEGGGFDGGLVCGGWHGDGAAQLTVDLQHQLDFVLLQGSVIRLGPSGIQQLALCLGIAQLGPQLVGQVRRCGIQAAQQQREAFAQHGLIARVANETRDPIGFLSDFLTAGFGLVLIDQPEIGRAHV